MEDNQKIVEDMQAVAAQMVQDDIEENPDIVNEYFDCSACGKNKCMAGSIQYSEYRLCNDCVVLAEVGFKLKKIKNIQELIDAMEDNRLETICDFIKKDSNAHNN
jgi:hypothetical protein